MYLVISVEISMTEVGEKESRLGGIVVSGKCGGMVQGAARCLK